jgi:hypothetical protein
MATMREVQSAHEAGRRAAEQHSTINEAVYSGAYDGTMDPVESIAWTMGFEGKELRSVTGWRYGSLPESGRSINHADNSWERGVSLMGLDGEERTTPAILVAGIALTDRPVVRVRGYLSGYGADGEPLVIGAEVIG